MGLMDDPMVTAAGEQASNNWSPPARQPSSA